jgi:hypothetical protein
VDRSISGYGFLDEPEAERAQVGHGTPRFRNIPSLVCIDYQAFAALQIPRQR